MPVAVEPRPAPPWRAGRRWWPLALLGVFLAGAGLHLPALTFEFLSWDDPRYVLDNARVHGLSLANLRAIFTEPYFHNYLPLHLLSYQIDYALWGPDALGFHLHSVLLHGLNSALLCLTLARIGAPRAVAAAAALLFAVHPSHVESVAWVSSRKDLLSMGFTLLSVLAYRSAGGRATWRGYLLSLVLFTAAVLSKAAVALLPCFFLLLDRLDGPPVLVPGGGRARNALRAALRAQAPFFLVAAAAVTVNSLVQATAAPTGGVAEYFLQKGFALWRYVLVLAGAAPGQPLYDEPDLSGAGPARLAALGGIALGLLGTSAVALAWRRRSRTVLLGGGWTLAMLAPALAFPLVTFMADRYLYAPSAGFAWLLAAGIARAAHRAGGARGTIAHACALAACVALFAGRTVLYLPVWRDSEALWSRVVAVSGSSLGRNALAAVRIRQGRSAEAETLLRDTAGVPDADTHRMRGVLLDKQGRYREALLAYERGLAVCARGGCSAEMRGALHFNRGVTYWHLGDYRASARAYEEAHRAAPDFAAAGEWAEKARRRAR